MKCPACSAELQLVVESGIEVDVCSEGCGGLWFDQHEFKKFDEPHESADQLLTRLNPKVEVDADSRRDCPKCNDIVMMRIFRSPKRIVEIDECPNCGSVWLDYGELETIRELFPSEQHLTRGQDARKAALAEQVDEDVEEYFRKRHEETERIRRFWNIQGWFRRAT